MINTIIFDYNGVLVNDLEIHEEAYWRAGQELVIHLTRETVRRYLLSELKENLEGVR